MALSWREDEYNPVDFVREKGQTEQAVSESAEFECYSIVRLNRFPGPSG